jgi:hypothetical protein
MTLEEIQNKYNLTVPPERWPEMVMDILSLFDDNDDGDHICQSCGTESRNCIC